MAAALVIIGAGMLSNHGALGPAPAGQHAISKLNVDQFQSAFNAASDQTRLLVTFSPT
ncbi:MAG TPA: hypothetical protein VK123_03835 [Candidatus Limnocylindrales bacterium]|nr:hypothetical protein [Candidatus Limnocylindrales bacterium]